MAYSSPLPLPDEHMRMVGIIAAHWEWLERVIVDNAVAEVMELKHDRIAVLLTNMNLHSKRDVLAVYAAPLKSQHPDLHKTLSNALSAVLDAYAERNKFVHATWQFGESGELLRFELRTKNGKFVCADHPAPINELEEAADKIVNAGSQLIAALQPFGLLKTSPAN